MGDRTIQNSKNNRDENEKETLLKLLRPIWQGHVESNHDLGFWRPLY